MAGQSGCAELIEARRGSEQELAADLQDQLHLHKVQKLFIGCLDRIGLPIAFGVADLQPGGHAKEVTAEHFHRFQNTRVDVRPARPGCHVLHPGPALDDLFGQRTKGRRVSEHLPGPVHLERGHQIQQRLVQAHRDMQV